MSRGARARPARRRARSRRARRGCGRRRNGGSACLEQAVRNQKEILLTSTAHTQEILDARGDSVGVELADGTGLDLSRQHPDFQYLFDRLTADKAAGDAAYIEYDVADRRIRDVRPVSLRAIEYVAAEPENGRRRVLDEARHTGRQVLVTDDIENMEIIDARFPREGRGPFES